MASVNMNSLMQARQMILNQNAALKDIAAGNVQNDQKVGDVSNGVAKTKESTAGSGVNSFTERMNDAIQEVNKLQSQAAEATKAYQMGETNDVAAVMLARHKASIGFESTLQVSNRLLSAYDDIMKMQV